MRRGTNLALAIATVFALSVPASAQVTPLNVTDIVPTDHITDLAEAFEALGDGVVYDIAFSNPGETFAVTDSIGDGEFSTGETPSQSLPVEFDIENFAAYLFTGNPETNSEKFSNVQDGGLFCGGGDSHPAAPDLRSFCQPEFDSTDFIDGAYVATFDLAGDFGLFNTTQICEFVVWYDDGTRNNIFNRLDQFPNDPADGTNTAFGIRSTLGEVQPFGLELTDGGFFQDMPTSTIGIFGGDEVSLLIPSMHVTEPSHMRAYTFCTGGSFSADDSFADTTVAFDPFPTELLVTEVVATTTTTSTTTTTTTTTTQPITTETTAPSVATSEEGGFPWLAVIIGGLILTAIGIWIAARKKGCEDELLAWQKAQKACDDAKKAHQDAKDAVDKAEKKLDDAEDELDELCDDMPPICYDRDIEDSWVEDPDVAGSRIDGFDLFARRQWGRANWQRYRDGEMTAQEVEQAWDQHPPEDFKDKLRTKYDKGKKRRQELDKEIEQADTDLEKAEQAEEDAEAKAEEACDKAAKAKAAYDLCMKKPTPTPTATGPGTGGTPGTGGGGTPGSTPGGEEPPEPCSPDGGTKEGSSRTQTFRVPLRVDPRISGGHAQAASEYANEIAGYIGQASVVAEALGRVFSFGSAGKVVTDFSVGGAADLGAGVVSEATGFPIPTNLPTAAANVGKTYLDAAKAIIQKVPELQARRLPDTDVTVYVEYEAYTMTCTSILTCKQGEWVETGRRLTVERGARSKGRLTPQTALTWAQAQAYIARAAQIHVGRGLPRELRKMKRFQDDCRGG